MATTVELTLHFMQRRTAPAPRTCATPYRRQYSESPGSEAAAEPSGPAAARVLVHLPANEGGNLQVARRLLLLGGPRRHWQPRYRRRVRLSRGRLLALRARRRMLSGVQWRLT